MHNGVVIIVAEKEGITIRIIALTWIKATTDDTFYISPTNYNFNNTVIKRGRANTILLIKELFALQYMILFHWPYDDQNQHENTARYVDTSHQYNSFWKTTIENKLGRLDF